MQDRVPWFKEVLGQDITKIEELWPLPANSAKKAQRANFQASVKPQFLGAFDTATNEQPI